MNTIPYVAEFHRAADQPINANPSISDQKVNELRVKLLREETRELELALEAGDPVEALDALVDLQYVLDGAILSLGYRNVFHQAFRAVHENNMTKAGPDGKFMKRADGKVIKPEGWKPPDLRKFVYGDDR